MYLYFSGSISGGRQDLALYRRIVDHLRAAGHEVNAGEILSATLAEGGESLGDEEIFRRDLDWIEEASRRGGVVVAEVSRPSLGVGYEIAAARYRFGMPVVALYRPAHAARCSAMVAGDAGIRLIRYEESGIEKALSELLKTLASLEQPATQQAGFLPGPRE